jgi:hypothetical protein
LRCRIVEAVIRNWQHVDSERPLGFSAVDQDRLRHGADFFGHAADHPLDNGIERSLFG